MAALDSAHSGHVANEGFALFRIKGKSRAVFSGIGGLQVFDVTGTFQDGRFGFYTFSQEAVKFRSFTVGADAPPVADIAPVATQECLAGGEWFTLDGTASHDPDGDPITFQWTAPGIVWDDATSPTPTAFFPVGTTPVTLAVRDGASVDTATTTVTVADSLPPVLQIVRPADGSTYFMDNEVAPGVPGAATVVVGGVTVNAVVHDDCGVDRVEFTASDGSSAVASNSPYSFFVNPPAGGPVLQQVTATATDLGGLQDTASRSFLQVGLAPPALPPPPL